MLGVKKASPSLENMVEGGRIRGKRGAKVGVRGIENLEAKML
jgi:hypothetical protein